LGEPAFAYALIAYPVEMLSLDIIHAKWLVGHEEYNHISFGTSPMLHDFSFGKPDEASRTIGSLVGYQRAL
jgi:hypothetical protein